MDKEMNNLFPESAQSLLDEKNKQLAKAQLIEKQLRALLLNVKMAINRSGDSELSDEISRAMLNIPMIEEICR